MKKKKKKKKKTCTLKYDTMYTSFFFFFFHSYLNKTNSINTKFLNVFLHIFSFDGSDTISMGVLV